MSIVLPWATVLSLNFTFTLEISTSIPWSVPGSDQEDSFFDLESVSSLSDYMNDPVTDLVRKLMDVNVLNYGEGG